MVCKICIVVYALNSGQLLVSILHSACIRHNGTKETATFATEEEQNRRELFAVAISWNKEAILCPSPWLHSAKLQQDSYGKLQCSGEDLVGIMPN